MRRSLRVHAPAANLWWGSYKSPKFAPNFTPVAFTVPAQRHWINIYIAARAEVQGQLVFEHKHTMLNEFSQLPQQMEHMPLPLSYSC